MSRVTRARAQRTSLGCLSLKRQASASAGSCALAATSSMHLAPSAVEMATSTTPQHELECTRTRRRQGEAGRQCERETCNMPQARRTNCQHTHTGTHTHEQRARRCRCRILFPIFIQYPRTSRAHEAASRSRSRLRSRSAPRLPLAALVWALN